MNETTMLDDTIDSLVSDEGEANEVIVWCSDVLACVNAVRTQPRLIKMPEHCAGSDEDEATVLGGILLALKIDPADPHATAKFLSELRRDTERSLRQTLADIESAVKQALARLEKLSADAGEWISPAILKLHAERDVGAGQEGLIDPAELPEGHRLKNLLPPAELIRGKWLAVGPWRQNLIGQRTPPGLISVAAIKQRTKLAARKVVDGSFGL